MKSVIVKGLSVYFNVSASSDGMPIRLLLRLSGQQYGNLFGDTSVFGSPPLFEDLR